MKHATIGELKNDLRRFLAYVRRGGTVRVFDRDQPIADLTPCSVAGNEEPGEVRLDALEREGLVRRGKGDLPADFLTKRLPKARASVVEALLDERRAAARRRGGRHGQRPRG